MPQQIDINHVQSVEVEPVAADPLDATERHARRIVVRTRFGVTTIVLHAVSASELELSMTAAPPGGG